MGGAGSTCLGCVLPVGGHSPAPQPLPLPCEDSELTPAVGCVCSLWCSSDSSHREAGDNHSRPTPQGVRPPPLLAHRRRKCACLSESHNCPVPAHLPREPRRSCVAVVGRNPTSSWLRRVAGGTRTGTLPGAQWCPKSPWPLKSGQWPTLLPAARRMREPEACCTLRKMSAFYQCVKPDPRWAPESKVARWGSGGRRVQGGRPLGHCQGLGTVIDTEASTSPSVLCSRIRVISCLTDFILSSPVVNFGPK
jgi:hypothetical protein